MAEPKPFLILDYGSQVSQLIARRLRELGYFSELLPYNTPTSVIREKSPVGIILSGGPSSVYDTNAPVTEVRDLEPIAPVMGICYGMQLLAFKYGGVVESSDKREYGYSTVEWRAPIAGVPKAQKVWMSHGDVVKVPPPGFEIIAFSASGHPAACLAPRIFAVQFHPEVSHTEHGLDVLRYFCRDICHAEPNWSGNEMLQQVTDYVQRTVPNSEKVLCALSGGVDSTVVGKLLTQVLGPERVVCVFVDNGLLRQNEFQDVLKKYQEMNLNVKGLDAKKLFLKRLEGVEDPEQKRTIIGHTFIDIFKEEIKKHDGKNDRITFLAQGTLYPDVIESISPRGASATIKTHHNVGGLPKDLNLKLVEPLRELFKDEVREIGAKLKIPLAMLGRHPFPGPGLAIRVLGEVTEERLRMARESDAIFIEELKNAGLYPHIWQAFTVLLPLKTVGVQGDGRTYENILALRAVTSLDGMTADWVQFPSEFLRKLSIKLIVLTPLVRDHDDPAR